MRVSLVSIALAVAVAGCASDGASVRFEDEMRVHGHDLVYDLGAGESFLLIFVADVPGIFEVDVHTGHAALFEVEVSG